MVSVPVFANQKNALLFLLVFFAGFSHAAFDSFATIDCSFSTPSKTISAQALHYSANAPSCVAMKLDVTMPNNSVRSYSSSDCSAGVHNFSSIPAPVNGVYKLRAYYLNSSADCSVAALFFENRPRVSELHPLLAAALALLALGLLRLGGDRWTKKSKGI